MNHPLAPPVELVRQWIPAGWDCTSNTFTTLLMRIATQAAQWAWDQRGAINEAELQKARDEELDACCHEVQDMLPRTSGGSRLRAARRPKPPSLKEESLNTLDQMSNCMGAGFIPKRSDLDTIRRALEALDD